MSGLSLNEMLRQIPAVDQLLLRPRVAQWISCTSRDFVVAEIQVLLQEIRSAIRSGDASHSSPVDAASLENRLSDRLQSRLRPALSTVINATGVILHTNLGRAPLSTAAQETLSAVSAHYTNLEYDLATGERSHRDKLIESALQELLGCQAALVVNNNAAAVFLILNTLAAGREVVVSRGELIEIGGSFRIPDILSRSGAVLREVGTTNKTRVRDYEAAIGPNTALLLRVHPSNYRIRGFVEKPELRDMVTLARRHQIPLVEDIGSGCLVDLGPYGISDEPIARQSIAAGVDVLCFSGDKLLGGPQAGIVAGARKWIEPIRTNPLMRTYRVEKLIYGALEATLASYRTGRALEDVPVLRMIRCSREEIEDRARRFAGSLEGRLPRQCRISLLNGNSVVGGGSCPDTQMPTCLVAIQCDTTTPNTVEQRLRQQQPPIVVRLEENQTLLDLRTVFPTQENTLLEGIIAAYREN